MLLSQIQRLEEAVQSTRDKLEESRELLKTNENGVHMSVICSFIHKFHVFGNTATIHSGFVHCAMYWFLDIAVIGWLNKQINEQMMGGGGRGPLAPNSLPLSTIRHSSPLTSTTAPPHTQHLVGMLNTIVVCVLLCANAVM